MLSERSSSTDHRSSHRPSKTRIINNSGYPADNGRANLNGGNDFFRLEKFSASMKRNCRYVVGV
jgi:hypothetical protein